MKASKKIVSLLLVAVMLFGICASLVGCGGGDSGEVIDNETTRLVLSTSELDGVFNPFYSSSASDGTIERGLRGPRLLGRDLHRRKR